MVFRTPASRSWSSITYWVLTVCLWQSPTDRCQYCRLPVGYVQQLVLNPSGSKRCAAPPAAPPAFAFALLRPTKKCLEREGVKSQKRGLLLNVRWSGSHFSSADHGKRTASKESFRTFPLSISKATRNDRIGSAVRLQ